MAKEKKNKISVMTVIKALLNGKILLLLGVDRLLPYILFLFILGWVNIFLNYLIEQTLSKVHKCDEVLEQKQKDYVLMEYEYVKSGKKTSIDEMLKSMNSEVTMPQKAATTIIID